MAKPRFKVGYAHFVKINQAIRRFHRQRQGTDVVSLRLLGARDCSMLDEQLFMKSWYDPKRSFQLRTGVWLSKWMTK